MLLKLCRPFCELQPHPETFRWVSSGILWPSETILVTVPESKVGLGIILKGLFPAVKVFFAIHHHVLPSRMSRSYNSSPQPPPWRVVGLLYTLFSIKNSFQFLKDSFFVSITFWHIIPVYVCILVLIIIIVNLIRSMIIEMLFLEY
jgi:hypothetical protein